MRRWAIRGVAILTALTLVVGIAAYQWWRHHPDAFAETTDEVDATFYLEVGEEMYLGMTFTQSGPPVSVTVHSARPRVVRDTADSTLELTVCTLYPPGFSPKDGALASVNEGDPGDVHLTPTVVIATAQDRIRELCSDRYAIDDEPFLLASREFAEPGQQILMLISGSKPGSVEIAGIDLDYSQGRQRGTRQIGEHLVVEVG